MDAVVRGRRLLLIGLGAFGIVATLFACGSGEPKTPIGVSEYKGRGTTPREPRDAGRDAASVLPAGYKTTFMKLNKARFVSSGHASGRWEIDVWANEAAQKAIAARAREVPVGAVVVQEHFERVEGRPAGPIMVMEKREPGFAPSHGDWRFSVVGASGQVAPDEVVTSCAGCHDDAPMDGLFPIVE